MQLQTARLLNASKWCAQGGGAVFLGNANRRFKPDCYTPCNGGLKVAVGCRWWHRVFGECNCRLVDALSWQ